MHNTADKHGRAVHLKNGKLMINTTAKMNFSNNTALVSGGAVHLESLNCCPKLFGVFGPGYVVYIGLFGSS